MLMKHQHQHQHADADDDSTNNVNSNDNENNNNNNNNNDSDRRRDYYCSRIIREVQTYLRLNMERSQLHLIAITSWCLVLSYFGTYVIKYPLFIVDYNYHDDGDDNNDDHEEEGMVTNSSSRSSSTIELKDWFSFAMTMGYFLGKFPSYALVPSIQREQRLYILCALFLIGAVGVTGLLPLQAPAAVVAATSAASTLSLLAWLQIGAIFVGSLSASAIFGVEFTYAEGRQCSDVLLAALNCVVLFGSSICRALGSSIITTLLIPQNLNPRWMPLLLVVLYAPITILALIGLDAVPDPTPTDTIARGRRTTMTPHEKTAFLYRHVLGLFPLVLGYAYMTGFRFLRDFYALEVYTEVLHREPAPKDYLLADWVGGILSVGCLLVLQTIHDNTSALVFLHGMFVGGGVIIGTGTYGFEHNMLSPESWIICVGIGVALSTTPFTGSLFDRIIASTRIKGTAVFLVFFADGVSYLGVLILLLYKTTTITTIIKSNNNTNDDATDDTTDATTTTQQQYSELFLRGCHVFTIILVITGSISATYWYRIATSVTNDENSSSNSVNTIIADSAYRYSAVEEQEERSHDDPPLSPSSSPTITTTKRTTGTIINNGAISGITTTTNTSKTIKTSASDTARLVQVPVTSSSSLSHRRNYEMELT